MTSSDNVNSEASPCKYNFMLCLTTVCKVRHRSPVVVQTWGQAPCKGSHISQRSHEMINGTGKKSALIFLIQVL